MEARFDALCAVEALDNGSLPLSNLFKATLVTDVGTFRFIPGKTFEWAKNADVSFSISTLRYYAGWADKIHGQTIETDHRKLVYTTHEPFGVVGQIIPWNFPRTSLSRFSSSSNVSSDVFYPPSLDVLLEDRSRSRHRKHNRHEALRADPFDRAHDR